MAKNKDFLSLKFNYIKYWNISEENAPALELIELIRETSFKTSIIEDLICLLIDLVDCETINLDFYEVNISKEEAKKYIRKLSEKY